MIEKTIQDLIGNHIISDECEIWLNSIGFYDKPASINHHGNEDGDLFNHSYEVAKQLGILTDKLELVWQRKESPLIVGLLHDVCKCDDYDLVNDDNAFTGESWGYNPNKIYNGHGDKSVMMLSSHLQLTEEEMYCICFHMGAFTDKDLWKFYSQAVNKYPNVLYTHTADMIASQVLNI